MPGATITDTRRADVELEQAIRDEDDRAAREPNGLFRRVLRRDLELRRGGEARTADLAVAPLRNDRAARKAWISSLSAALEAVTSRPRQLVLDASLAPDEEADLRRIDALTIMQRQLVGSRSRRRQLARLSITTPTEAHDGHHALVHAAIAVCTVEATIDEAERSFAHRRACPPPRVIALRIVGCARVDRAELWARVVAELVDSLLAGDVEAVALIVNRALAPDTDWLQPADGAAAVPRSSPPDLNRSPHKTHGPPTDRAQGRHHGGAFGSNSEAIAA